MSGTVAAICYFIAFIMFIVAAVISWPVARWPTFIAVGLAFWVFVLLWAAMVRA
jgi:hypothetical protein